MTITHNAREDLAGVFVSTDETLVQQGAQRFSWPFSQKNFRLTPLAFLLFRVQLLFTARAARGAFTRVR